MIVEEISRLGEERRRFQQCVPPADHQVGYSYITSEQRTWIPHDDKIQVWSGRGV